MYILIQWRDSIFICEKMIFKKDFRVATYFCLFLKGKQNKKENFKCDS